jgi:peptidoglycan hydrolase CwlO-like protein
MSGSASQADLDAMQAELADMQSQVAALESGRQTDQATIAQDQATIAQLQSQMDQVQQQLASVQQQLADRSGQAPALQDTAGDLAALDAWLQAQTGVSLEYQLQRMCAQFYGNPLMPPS